MDTNNKKYSLKVISDQKTEPFSVSKCSCKKCKDMHNSQLEWDTLTPTTNLQKRMKNVIKNIENKYT